MPGVQSDDTLITVIISGQNQALDELCRHWLFSYALQERDVERAVFRIQKKAIHTYVPYFLLPYGRAIAVVEPDILRKRMIEVLEEMMGHYRQQI
ncbi:putative DNA-binding transcriptional regulator YafY [Paenibacillus shirakamiensis]|uniref:DNA-binding transcriptional regulator YafY n=1 Tax=Paenibacillus shirakamiensis TaxID=1265935 RepID=A0ABS4JBN0_9BACL|nr:hypothetical protein [Paenibacillus shirakamiensis]MBP1999103.1 putative DNA-binding transcriptional regulator YafY [Paenibacillus shirakamiensis]